MTRLADDHLYDLVETERNRVATIPAEALDRPVPHLDGWTVHTVIGHTAWVCRFVARSLEATPDDPPNRAAVGEPPVGPAVLDWYREGADAVAKALAGTDLEAPRPTFTGAQPGRWWLRRLAHELAIHRWDADLAATGAPVAVEAAQALDAIDEVLEVFVPHRMQFDTLDAAGSTIHLHTTDVDDGEWLLAVGAESLEWERTHAKGNVAARGSASDLLLLLWSRVDPSAVEVFGDAELLRRWQTASAF